MSFRHVVRAGECLASLAARHGFAHWRDIYDHPANAELRKLRPNPLVLAAGDEVVIPPPRPKELALATNDVHRIVVTRPLVAFRVTVRDAQGEPLAAKPFRLEWTTGGFDGTTTGDGELECPIPVMVAQAQLVVWRDQPGSGARYVWDVELGHLDPVALPSGVRQRLNNLGYFAGRGASGIDDGLRFALRAFQEDEGLDITGEPDEPTAAKLMAAHGDV